MTDATVFSQTWQVILASPVTRGDLEKMLTSFLNDIGRPLSYHGVIVGHIKVLVRLPRNNDFLFLSLTRLDVIDVKPSPGWYGAVAEAVGELALHINVLLFGFSKDAVAQTVAAALQKSGLGTGQWQCSGHSHPHT